MLAGDLGRRTGRSESYPRSSLGVPRQVLTHGAVNPTLRGGQIFGSPPLELFVRSTKKLGSGRKAKECCASLSRLSRGSDSGQVERLVSARTPCTARAPALHAHPQIIDRFSSVVEPVKSAHRMQMWSKNWSNKMKRGGESSRKQWRSRRPPPRPFEHPNPSRTRRPFCLSPASCAGQRRTWCCC